tara:strand:- start:16334 stop:16585 length:252 start_codon:yes stop_codon:yes gene_type:complete
MASKSRFSKEIDISDKARRKRLEDKTKGKKTYASPTTRERATNTFVSDQEKARKKLEEFDERAAARTRSAARRGVSAPYGSGN